MDSVTVSTVVMVLYYCINAFFLVAVVAGFFRTRNAQEAVLYGIVMAVNIGWPRNEIYGAGNYMWGGLIFIVGALAIGGIYFALAGQHNMGVLDSHSSSEEESLLAREQAFGGP